MNLRLFLIGVVSVLLVTVAVLKVIESDTPITGDVLMCQSVPSTGEAGGSMRCPGGTWNAGPWMGPFDENGEEYDEVGPCCCEGATRYDPWDGYCYGPGEALPPPGGGSSSASSVFSPFASSPPPSSPPASSAASSAQSSVPASSAASAASSSASSIASSAQSSSASSSRNSSLSSSRSSSSRCGYSPIIMGMMCCPAPDWNDFRGIRDFGQRVPTMQQLMSDPTVYHRQPSGAPICMEYVYSTQNANCEAVRGPDPGLVESLASLCPDPPPATSSQSSGGSSHSSSKFSGSSTSSSRSSSRSSSSGCSTDADCPGSFQICDNGYCVGDWCPPTGPCECNDMGQCPAGMGCSNGLCTSSSQSSNRSSMSSNSSNSNSSSSRSSVSSSSSRCTSNAQCPSGQQCVNGSCTGSSASSSRSSSSIRSCSLANPCPLGEICMSGQCFPTSAISSAHSSSRSSVLSCTSNGQCPSGQQCLNGQCTNNDCTSSQQCPSGQSCVNGDCTNNDCTSSNQCPSGEQCLNGNCTPPPGCNSSFDCPSGALCINGQCAPCTANNQCPGNRCINGTCSPCTSSAQCPSGFQCSNGQCKAPASASSAVPVTFDGMCLGNECGLGGSTFCANQNLSCVTTAAFPCIRCEGPLAQTSSAAFSSSSANPQLSCDSSLDCPSGQSCINGFCSMQNCTSNNQCVRGEQCLNGRCTLSVPSLACSTDIDCAQGERCVQGACLTPLELSDLPSFCGNARLDPGEFCDDGSMNSLKPNAKCRIDCMLSRCGDGILDTPLELCDDGNALSNDGCSATCQTERGAPNQTLPAQIIELPFQNYECNRDEDCESNLCISGSCQSCASNTQCASGFCNNGVCSMQQTLPGAPVTPSTGPAALLIMIAGAAAGYSIVKRK